MSKEKKQKLKENQKKKRKKIDFLSFLCIKNGTEAVYFGENGIMKVLFMKIKNPLILMK